MYKTEGLRACIESADRQYAPCCVPHLPSLEQQQQLPMLPALDEHVLLQRPEFPYPRETLRPGRVVWAKVEGHDWWPAKIVRRRAVPREVRTHVPTISY